MMILVSILGNFHSSVFPIYNEFKDKISTHIVVHDDAFSEQLKDKKIIRALEVFNAKHKLNIITQEHKLDEDSFTSINRLIETLNTLNTPLENIYINTTDGLSNISTVLASKLLSQGVNFIAYDMYENSYNLTTQESMKNIKLTSSLSIQDHLELKGFEVSVKGDLDFAHKNKDKILKLFNNYAHEMEFLNKDITQQSTLHKEQYKHAAGLVQSMGLDASRNAPEITGGLFEYYVYLLVKDMGFDEIAVGVVINQPIKGKISVTNEFDILLMKDNHLHMIECKFRKNVSKHELVYKYAALINVVDDDAMIMILTNVDTYSQNIYDEKDMSLASHRRAFLNNIALRGSILKHKQEFLDDVRTLFL